MILILAVFGGCKKPNQRFYTIPIQQELKAYFATAKSGSFFVYQDTVSGAIDTFKISNYTESFWAQEGCGYRINNKEATYSIIQYLYNTTFKKKVFNFQLTSNCENALSSSVEMQFGASGAKMKINVINNQFPLLPKIQTLDDSITPTYYHTYRNWGGEFFQDVYYFDSMSEDFGGLTYDYVIARNIGIIGYKSRVGEYWRLVDKKIVL